MSRKTENHRAMDIVLELSSPEKHTYQYYLE